MKTDPLADAADIMREAGVQLEQVSNMMDALQAQQQDFIQQVNKVLDYTDKLEIERNAWRFRAEEMEKERDRARCEIIKLRERISEPCCPECGWPEPMVVRGGDESWVECPECGTKEGLR